jgi:hypothetical protein
MGLRQTSSVKAARADKRDDFLMSARSCQCPVPSGYRSLFKFQIGEQSTEDELAHHRHVTAHLAPGPSDDIAIVPSTIMPANRYA